MTDPDVARLSGEVRRLSAALADLEATLTDLKTALAAELRTRRVVVVAADGTERVRIEAAPTHGSVVAQARSERAGTTGAEIYAVDGIDGDGPEVGLVLIRDGDVIERRHMLFGPEHRR